MVLNFAEEGEEDASAQQVQNEVASKVPQQVDSARGGKQTPTSMFYPSSSNSNLNDDQGNGLLNQVAAVEDKLAQPLSSQKTDRR